MKHRKEGSAKHGKFYFRVSKARGIQFAFLRQPKIDGWVFSVMLWKWGFDYLIAPHTYFKERESNAK